jgi:SAM-dependent methyltransferase
MDAARTLLRMDRHWEEHAEEWAAWARTPDHDSFWHFNGEAFLSLLPSAARRTLDLGCGEGRLTRELKRLGHSVVGIDAAPSMVRLAQAEDPDGDYVVADAAQLPFPDASFDLVVAFMSLMDVDDLQGAVSESARVLEPGGILALAVTHPVNDAGTFESQEADSPFVIDGSYFGKRRWEDRTERAGLRMHFMGWAYPLEAYARALEQSGLLIEAIREPVPSEELSDRLPGYQRWRRVPLFLHVRAVRLSNSG